MDGYGVHAKDGNIGHIEDFIIDEKTWSIRYLVIGTRNWWPSKKVVIPPQWIDSIGWADSKVVLDLTQDQRSGTPPNTRRSPAHPRIRNLPARTLQPQGLLG